VSELTIKKYKLESLADLGKTNTSIIECINSMVETDEPTRYTVKLILSELIINGFIHGKAEELNLEIAIDAENSILEITIEDGGAGFDVVHSVREPNVDSEQGRGLILVRAFSHDVVYNNIGNKVKATVTL